jgi:hypothetical protein
MAGSMWLPTYLGEKFDITNPDPNKVRIVDIAHALSGEGRFANHLICTYSVAEHTCRMVHLAPDKVKARVLLHEASEAYMRDMPRPVKLLMPNYIEYEEGIQVVVNKKYGVVVTKSPEEAYFKEMDAAFPVVEAKLASLHRYPDSLPPLNGEENPDFLKIVKGLYKSSNRYSDSWGWSRAVAFWKFIEYCEQLLPLTATDIVDIEVMAGNTRRVGG